MPDPYQIRPDAAGRGPFLETLYMKSTSHLSWFFDHQLVPLTPFIVAVPANRTFNDSSHTGSWGAAVGPEIFFAITHVYWG